MLIATAILGFSIVGLIILLSVKALEMRAGSKFFPGMRGSLDRTSVSILEFLRNGLPRGLSRFVRGSGKIGRMYISFASAKGLFYFERVLERVLHKVRTSPTNLKERGEASPFLREVAAYKRMLEREEEKKEDIPLE